MRVGTVAIEGNDHIATATLTPLLNTTPGQLLSPRNLAGDRERWSPTTRAAASTRQRHVTQQPEPADPTKVDVVFHVDEGQQIFVRNVLLTGLEYTRPQTVARAITIHAGDPLNQTALTDTQRNLYELRAVQRSQCRGRKPQRRRDPQDGSAAGFEARRWTLTYGFGFEAQTGQPQNNCAGAIAGGVACNPNGKTGVSPRVLADITRNNLFGREQSASLHGTYGLLEQSIELLYQVPHFEGNRNFGFTFSGGYANSQDVTTYVASRLEGGFRFTENFNRPGSWLSQANTFIYEIDFRRVKVAASSLQVYPGEISELSTATRVGGPAFTWIRDTRDVPMDAHRGTYTSFQEFLSDRPFGAEAEFNRIDTSNSSYYGFDKGRFVLARNTRYGQMRAFGSGIQRADSAARAALRRRPDFAARIFVRMPPARAIRKPASRSAAQARSSTAPSCACRPPTLALVRQHASALSSFTTWAMSSPTPATPGPALCASASPTATPAETLATDRRLPNRLHLPTGPYTSTGQQGMCSFNYFSHALGRGLALPHAGRAHPFRLQLQPESAHLPGQHQLLHSHTASAAPSPGFQSDPYVGQAPHINFFFSLGQTF